MDEQRQRADEIEEMILKMETEAVLDELLEGFRTAHGRDAVILKETRYEIRPVQ